MWTSHQNKVTGKSLHKILKHFIEKVCDFCFQWRTINCKESLQSLFSICLILLFLKTFLLVISSVNQSYPTLWDPMDCSMPGLPVHHQIPEFTQTHVHWVGDAIQPSHPLLSPSSIFNLSQHQGLFQWVSSSCQVANVLEFQLQHQSFQCIFRTDFL